jgi:1,4-dihydroxy-2-naphthoate octaprenyltransferase
VLTNLQNDIGFTARGSARVGERVGLPRATANGWLSAGAVRAAIVLLSLVAIGLGAGMVVLRGWPVLLLGAASLVAALAYMGGPKPIAYTPFGELTVFVFFGLVAVLGTDWLLTDQLSLASLLAACAIGSLSAAALGVNNHRDMDHDRLVGRRTFAICFGARASNHLLATLLLLPFALSLGLVVVLSAPLFVLPLVLLPTALQLVRDIRACPGGRAYNALLFRVFRLELWFALALCVAALLTRL